MSRRGKSWGAQIAPSAITEQRIIACRNWPGEDTRSCRLNIPRFWSHDPEAGTAKQCSGRRLGGPIDQKGVPPKISFRPTKTPSQLFPHGKVVRRWFKKSHPTRPWALSPQVVLTTFLFFESSFHATKGAVKLTRLFYLALQGTALGLSGDVAVAEHAADSKT